MIQAHPEQLHRANTVRLEQGISIRSVARRLDMSQADTRELLDETHNLSLRDLYRLQAILEVPVATLLVESNDPLSPAVSQRAQFVRLSKTVQSLLELNGDPSLQRHLRNLSCLVFEIFPEGAEVSAWHTVGQRRTANEPSYRDEHPIRAFDGMEDEE